MFGKPQTPGSTFVGDPLTPRPAPASASSKTMIGSGSRVVGDLISDEEVLLEGQVEGKIHGERGIMVAAGGEVLGDVAARSVVVGGRVRGQIIAAERAELTSTAVVHGSVQAPKIIIAEGAHLQGNVAMSPGGEAPAPRGEPPAPRGSEEP